MRLQDANISCIFVQSGYPEKQSRFLRKVNLAEIRKKQNTYVDKNDSESELSNNDNIGESKDDKESIQAGRDYIRRQKKYMTNMQPDQKV